MKRYGVGGSLLLGLFASPTTAFAAGDLSRQTPVELRVQLGDEKGVRRFFPEKLELETGKLYRLILSNPSPEMHYFSSDALSQAVFTRKVQVNGPDGKPIAEIKGSIREMRFIRRRRPNGGSYLSKRASSLISSAPFRDIPKQVWWADYRQVRQDAARDENGTSLSIKSARISATMNVLSCKGACGECLAAWLVSSQASAQVGARFRDVLAALPKALLVLLHDVAHRYANKSMQWLRTSGAGYRAGLSAMPLAPEHVSHGYVASSAGWPYATSLLRARPGRDLTPLRRRTSEKLAPATKDRCCQWWPRSPIAMNSAPRLDDDPKEAN